MLTETEEKTLEALLRAELRDQAEESLSAFIRQAWEVLEPGTNLLWNWHIDAIAEHLEAVHSGEIKKLIINMPPRYLKSISVTVCFPVWSWLHDATKQFFCVSYAESLSIKHNVDRRDLILSPWFQGNWGDRFKLKYDTNRLSKFANDKRGQMFATGATGRGTGEGGDCLIFDDPQNPKMADSDLEREKVNRLHDTTFSTRKNDKKKSAEIIVMQRLHESDLCGHVKKKQPGRWTELVLPGQCKSRTVYTFPITKRTKIYEEGEYLHPEREGEEEHSQRKEELGPVDYPAQYDQDPKPSGSGLVKRHYWRRYTVLPKDIFRIRQYIDCAEEPGITNDYSVITTIAEAPSGYYWLSVWRKRVAFPELETGCIDNYVKEWHETLRPEQILIEKKSAGVQLIQSLGKKTKLPLAKFDPGRRNKRVRIGGVIATIAAGNCYLPSNASWVEDFIDEHERFPFAKHDDMVDTTSMGLEDLQNDIVLPRARSL